MSTRFVITEAAERRYQGGAGMTTACQEADLRCPRTAHGHGSCARCGGPACARCERCHGCGQLVCERCDVGTEATERFAWPGDEHAHPHTIRSAA